jgi:hypothetical protein
VSVQKIDSSDQELTAISHVNRKHDDILNMYTEEQNPKTKIH